MTEIWKDCAEDTDYMVSSMGRVKSKSRWIKCGPGKGTRLLPEKMLVPWISSKTGYLQIQLGKRKKVNLHRLVAIAFVEGCKPGFVVNHKNGSKTDNSLENLEWVTSSENQLHSYRELGRKGSQTGRFSSLHHVSKPVIATCNKTGKQMIFDCAIDAVRMYGFDSGGISRCCYGLSGSHKGYSWEFADEALMSYPEAQQA